MAALRRRVVLLSRSRSRARRGAPRTWLALGFVALFAARCSARSSSRASTSGRPRCVAARSRRSSPGATGSASGLLGAAVAAKLYPGVLVPLARRLDVWRRRGRREALLVPRVFAAVVALALPPVPRARAGRGLRTASAASSRGRCRSRASARRCCSPRTTSSASTSTMRRATARRTSPGTAARGARCVTSVAQLGRARVALWVALRARPGRPRAARALRGGGARRVRRAREGALAAVPDLARPARRRSCAAARARGGGAPRGGARR